MSLICARRAPVRGHRNVKNMEACRYCSEGIAVFNDVLSRDSARGDSLYGSPSTGAGHPRRTPLQMSILDALTKFMLDREVPKEAVWHLWSLGDALQREARTSNAEEHWLCAVLNGAAEALEALDARELVGMAVGEIIGKLPEPYGVPPISTILNRLVEQVVAKFVSAGNPLDGVIVILNALAVFVCPADEGCDDSQAAAARLLKFMLSKSG